VKMRTVPIAVSVIIPTYARAKQLRRCVESVLASRLDRGAFEVIVVDDGSPESMAWVESEYGVRCLRLANGGPARARNSGAKVAEGGLLAFVDDDCVVDSEWLGALLEANRANPEAALGGVVVNGLKANLYAEASQELTNAIYAYMRKWPRGPERSLAPFFTSNNLAVPKQQFAELGGFDERFPLAAAEDRDYCRRIMEWGWKLVTVDEAVVVHEHGMNWKRYCRQHWNYGRGALQMRKLLDADGKQYVGAEPWWFYWWILRWPWKGQEWWESATLSGLIGLSQAMTVAGVLSEAIRPSRPLRRA